MTVSLPRRYDEELPYGTGAQDIDLRDRMRKQPGGQLQRAKNCGRSIPNDADPKKARNEAKVRHCLPTGLTWGQRNARNWEVCAQRMREGKFRRTPEKQPQQLGIPYELLTAAGDRVPQPPAGDSVPRPAAGDSVPRPAEEAAVPKRARVAEPSGAAAASGLPRRGEEGVDQMPATTFGFDPQEPRLSLEINVPPTELFVVTTGIELLQHLAPRSDAAAQIAGEACGRGRGGGRGPEITEKLIPRCLSEAGIVGERAPGAPRALWAVIDCRGLKNAQHSRTLHKHVGTHPDILHSVLEDEAKFTRWLEGAMSVVLRRSVACATILQHLFEAAGLRVSDTVHTCRQLWHTHSRVCHSTGMCEQCRGESRARNETLRRVRALFRGMAI